MDRAALSPAGQIHGAAVSSLLKKPKQHVTYELARGTHPGTTNPENRTHENRTYATDAFKYNLCQRTRMQSKTKAYSRKLWRQRDPKARTKAEACFW